MSRKSSTTGSYGTKVVITCEEQSRDGSWNVRVGKETTTTRPVEYSSRTFELRDPWANTDNYKYYFKSVTATENGGTNKVYKVFFSVATAETAFRLYRNDLTEQLHKIIFEAVGLRLDLQRGHVRISIHEEVDFSSDTSGDQKVQSIHSLLWELLENLSPWEGDVAAGSGPELKITRIIDTNHGLGERRDYQAQPWASCRILLVVARSFQVVQMMHDGGLEVSDAEPGLILSNLLDLASYLEESGICSHFSVEVVRPGTFARLEEFCRGAKEAGKTFDIVHFDLHGLGGPRPKLRFGRAWKGHLKPYKERNPNPEYPDFGDIGYEDVDISKVAGLLGEIGVRRVALNACCSSSAHHGAFYNMTCALIGQGVSLVSAMSSRVQDNTARDYYAAFYRALILDGQSFKAAAARGRVALLGSARTRLDAHAAVTLQDRVREALIPTAMQDRIRSFRETYTPKPPAMWTRNAQILAAFFAVLVLVLPLFACSYFHPVAHLILPSFLQRRIWKRSRIDDNMATPASAAMRLGIQTLAWLHTSILAVLVFSLFSDSIYRKIVLQKRYLFYLVTNAYYRSDHCTRFQNYLDNRSSKALGQHQSACSPPSSPTGHSRPRVGFTLSIEHMILEDLLASFSNVYLASEDRDKMAFIIRSLANIWMRTGFIEDARIKKAGDFHRSFSPFWRAESLRSGLGSFNLSGGRSRLVVVEGMEDLLVANDVLHPVDWSSPTFQRMDAWIRAQVHGSGPGGAYVLLTGSRGEDIWKDLRDKWPKSIGSTWGGAQPFTIRTASATGPLEKQPPRYQVL